MREFLNIQENRLEKKYFLILMLLAFIFSLVIRYIWVYQFGATDAFHWNGELMINTNDGYYWAEGARDILAGLHQDNDLSPVSMPLAHLTALLAKILPISFETLILWMPAFFGSLLIVPIMLIGRLFGHDLVGFVAALLGGIAWSYYNRTMVGYYDTDMLIVVLPTFMMWGMLYALKKEMNQALIIAPIFAILSMDWHAGTINIVNTTFFLTLLYTLFFERKNIYYYKFLSVLILAMATLPMEVKFLLVIVLVMVYHLFKDRLSDKIIYGIVIVSTIVFLVFGGMSWIIGVLGNVYLVRALHASNLDFSLHYYGVVNTVREAGHIPFETFANRISGDIIAFWLSLLGYILFILRHRLMLLTLPMVGLGFFALQGGLRFTVFAVPFMALGMAYLIFVIVQRFTFKQKSMEYGLLFVLTVAVLYPNIAHIISYRVPVVMTKDEVKVLEKLKKIASREDYVVTWWDYGYPVRYYADVKTLIDGAKHGGGANFPTSFVLLNNQIAAANMMRMDVEFTEKNFKEYCGDTSFECMLNDANMRYPERFLKYINNKEGVKLPKKTRNIYIYLPNRMMNIIPTIDLFSNLNLSTGKQYKRPIFQQAFPVGYNNGIMKLSNGMEIEEDTGILKIGKQRVPINQLVTTQYDENQNLKKSRKIANIGADVYVIFMKSYNKVLILDKRMFYSLYVQLFVLENYDKDLYEPVILDPRTKIYRLKI